MLKIFKLYRSIKDLKPYHIKLRNIKGWDWYEPTRNFRNGGIVFYIDGVDHMPRTTRILTSQSIEGFELIVVNKTPLKILSHEVSEE